MVPGMDVRGGESAQGVGRAGDSLEGEVKIMGAEKVLANCTNCQTLLEKQPG